jgi:hypothetical protein
MAMPLRILARDKNDQGDLLTRLARDLFFALGYDNCRINIHKTGRELDLTAIHRFESRSVVAEFKSGSEPSGGSDINKFVGVLDGQRRKADAKEVHGYFISLGGFRETAIEQEKEFDNDRVVLLDGRKARQELITSKIVVTAANASLAAKGLLASRSNLTIENEHDLVGHELGWIWAIYLTVQRERKAVCLVHADGTPLSLRSANHVIAVASAIGDPIAELKLLNRNDPVRSTSAFNRRYRDYILREFGGITLEGLPVDQLVGSGQFKLEDLYVPLRLKDVAKRAVTAMDASTAGLPSDGDVTQPSNELVEESQNLSLGEAIERYPHLAILGLPGSGKSTALKRLAVAYADQRRRTDTDDNLPRRPWFPIVLRCRHIASHSRDPIIHMIRSQVNRAEMPEFQEEYSAVISAKLRDGNLLLLIDGLDEIPAAGDRTAFISQLRTFIGVYPTCRLVVTSREAGFRSVAAAVNSICHQTHVDELTDSAIRELISSWHHEVVGNTEVIRTKAIQLGDDIMRNDRVRSLATNPLLLTTLLLVQRWIGQLPRRRSVLYQKAIEVLLMTWNAEGHQPLDPDEALPQLAYIAYSMMAQGTASVTSHELISLLNCARNDLPEVLSYAQMSPREFLDRVEERSSLMTVSGHQLSNGSLVPTYEFKHLTFQEYLAALGIAHGWIDARFRQRPIIDTLRPRLRSESWQEVVTLTSVLGGSQASELVSTLIGDLRPAVRSSPENEKSSLKRNIATIQLRMNLIGCLRDEAPITPDLANEAIELCIRTRKLSPSSDYDLAQGLYGGRYDSALRAIAYDNFNLREPMASSFGSVLSNIGASDCAARPDGMSVIEWIQTASDSEDITQQKLAPLVLMGIFFDAASASRRGRSKLLLTGAESAIPLVELAIDQFMATPSGNDAVTFAKLWCLAWGLRVSGRTITQRRENALQLKIVETWRRSNTTILSRQAAWALCSTDFVGRWAVDADCRSDIAELAAREARSRGESRRFRQGGSLVIRRYLEPASDRQRLLEDIRVYRRGVVRGASNPAERLLESLGPDGRRVLAEIRRQRNRTGQLEFD